MLRLLYPLAAAAAPTPASPDDVYDPLTPGATSYPALANAYWLDLGRALEVLCDRVAKDAADVANVALAPAPGPRVTTNTIVVHLYELDLGDGLPPTRQLAVAPLAVLQHALVSGDANDPQLVVMATVSVRAGPPPGPQVPATLRCVRRWLRNPAAVLADAFTQLALRYAPLVLPALDDAAIGRRTVEADPEGSAIPTERYYVTTEPAATRALATYWQRFVTRDDTVVAVTATSLQRPPLRDDYVGMLARDPATLLGNVAAPVVLPTDRPHDPRLFVEWFPVADERDLAAYWWNDGLRPNVKDRVDELARRLELRIPDALALVAAPEHEA